MTNRLHDICTELNVTDGERDYICAAAELILLVFGTEKAPKGAVGAITKKYSVSRPTLYKFAALILRVVIHAARLGMRMGRPPLQDENEEQLTRLLGE